MLKIVRTTENRRGSEYEVVEADRLDDMRVSRFDRLVCRHMMRHLADWVMRPRSCQTWSVTGARGEEEAKRLKAAWRLWLAEHRNEVLEENGFVPGDPSLNPELFPEGMYWITKDRRTWPLGRAYVPGREE